MSNYDPTITYNNPAYGQSYYNQPVVMTTSPGKKLGHALMGGLIGMGAYYLPVNKDVFVNKAFKVHKEQVGNDIKSLTQTASTMSISSGDLSIENKLMLQKLGVSENLTAVMDKAKDLEKSITDSAIVKNTKKGFENGFEAFKKSASSMDNITNEAMQRVRWSAFKWGAGIGAALFLAGTYISDKK